MHVGMRHGCLLRAVDQLLLFTAMMAVLLNQHTALCLHEHAVHKSAVYMLTWTMHSHTCQQDPATTTFHDGLLRGGNNNDNIDVGQS
jgi:hypothetical protein